MYLYCRADDSRELSEPASGGSGAASAEQTATKFAQRMADRLPALAAAEVGAAARFRGDGVALMEQRRALDGVARAERAGDDGTGDWREEKNIGARV